MGQKQKRGFEIETETGKKFSAKKLIFGTGIKDLIPNIKGFKECWGISVIHCPYCHGYEFKQQVTAIFANTEKASHMVPLIYNLTKKLSIITVNKSEFGTDKLHKFESNGIELIESEIQEIIHKNGEVRKVIFKDGTSQTFDAIYAPLPFVQHSDIPEKLGCELNEQGLLKVNVFQQTNIIDIYACGDNSSPMRSVSNAVASGNLAGAAVNKELSDQEF